MIATVLMKAQTFSLQTLATMIDKMNGQLNLCQRLRAIDARTVASSVIRSHFLPDLAATSTLTVVKSSMPQMRSFLSPNAACRSLYTTTESRWTWAIGAWGCSKRRRALQWSFSAYSIRRCCSKIHQVTKHVMDTYGVDTYTKAKHGMVGR